ncbi:epimerase/dehydratase [Marmoricola endophyticus]|uniref:Epimerase/dehydratase n=1 Tax=Marmoricola endophyticus TaxID=2040280 RepID=A0A917F4H1_9ACTN|nr:NAD-dependent epimerase/dehydratase family protein [Marmoricola endophyticus]GGF51774.1 epimerase/dehydratase [Marmoricola endophyticus]
MRVLVTGGAGFTGQHLARRLVAGGHEVTALDLLHPQVHPDPDGAVAAFPGTVTVADVADEDAWTGLASPDAVVHLAAETGTGQSMYEADRYHRVNVDGTALAGRFAQERGVPLVTASSRAVYGEGRYACPEHGTRVGGPCCDAALPVASTEDDEHRPVSVYGETKSAGERSLHALDVPVTVVRPQNVVGPGQSLHNPYTGVLAAFLAMLREGRPLTVYGDGHQTRDLVHVADVADLLAWCLEHPPEAARPRVLNCGTGVRTTLLDLARLTADGRPEDSRGPFEIAHLDVRRAGDITHACADLTHLAALGAPLPTRSTADAVADFVAHAWARPGAAAAAWDGALDELARRGLTG